MASKIHTPSQHALHKCLDQGTLTSSNGTALDTLGYEAVMFTFDVTTQAASTLDAVLQDSPDNSAWTNVTGSNIAQVVASQTKLTRVVDVNVAKRNRYLRWVYTVAGTVTASVGAKLFSPDQYPVTQDNAVVTLS